MKSWKSAEVREEEREIVNELGRGERRKEDERHEKPLGIRANAIDKNQSYAEKGEAHKKQCK